jgi:hypothetical protein
VVVIITAVIVHPVEPLARSRDAPLVGKSLPMVACPVAHALITQATVVPANATAKAFRSW